MKDYLQTEVDGRKFFKTYILFFIPILILTIIAAPPYDRGFGPQLLSLAESYLSLLLQFSFFCYLITTVMFRNTGFPFTASLGHFAPRGALWIFLSTITMGLYGPWFIRNCVAFFLDNLSWNGKQARFLGQPKKLLGFILLFIYLPVIVVSGLYFLRFGEDWIFMAIPGFLILLLSMHLFHIYLRWLVNLEYSGYQISFQSTPGETFRMLAGQVFLCLITVGIYIPAAWVRIYTFVTGKITFENEQGESKAVLGFDGKVGEGFLLFWGQALLCLITVGFYGPWAMARVSSFVLNKTFLEGDIDI